MYGSSTLTMTRLLVAYMDLYAENILDHYKHPHKKGSVISDQFSVTHEEKNLSCGDRLNVGLTIENDIIKDIAWDGEGCAISQASMSMLADELVGKNLKEVDALTPQSIFDLIQVPVGTRRLKCALLCLHALKNALHSYRNEPLQSWQETVGNDTETR